MTLPRGASYPRGATKLWWADASFELVQQVYREARADVRWFHDSHSDPTLGRQPWLRAVSKEFHRRLRVLGLYVEEA